MLPAPFLIMLSTESWSGMRAEAEVLTRGERHPGTCRAQRPEPSFPADLHTERPSPAAGSRRTKATAEILAWCLDRVSADVVAFDDCGTASAADRTRVPNRARRRRRAALSAVRGGPRASASTRSRVARRTRGAPPARRRWWRTGRGAPRSSSARRAGCRGPSRASGAAPRASTVARALLSAAARGSVPAAATGRPGRRTRRRAPRRGRPTPGPPRGRPRRGRRELGAM